MRAEYSLENRVDWQNSRTHTLSDYLR